MSLIVGGLIGVIAAHAAGMEDDVCKRLGANLKRLRNETGRTQEDFADYAGINRTYISDLERGARNPTVRVVDKLAKALGVGLGALLD